MQVHFISNKNVDALKSNKTLTKLDISNNNLGDEGGISFGNALKWNSSILFLDLSTNKIGDAGGSEFATMLAQNKTIQVCLKRNLIF